MSQDNNIITQLKRQFNNDAYDMAQKAFSGSGITKLRLIDTTQKFYRYLDDFLTQFESFVAQQGQKIACAKGCSTCCYQAVFLSPFEALYLAENIRKHCTQEEQERIKERVKQKKEATENMSASEYLNYRHACPLLDEKGTCMFHKYRPVACRIYLSEDLKSCREQHQNPTDNKLFAKLYDLPLQTGRAYCEGMNQYFIKHKLSVQEIKFEDALFIALNDEKSLNKWLSKNTLFETKYSAEDLLLFNQFNTQKGMQ